MIRIDAKKFPYPKSFPTQTEETFLHLILSSEAVFTTAWEAWSKTTNIDDVDSATAGLFPLLSMRLRAHNINAPSVDRIHGVYRFAWFKNQRLLEAVRIVVAACKDRAIPVVVLKGIPLLLSVYKDAGARTLGDGDILIRSTDALRVFDLLRSMGWKHEDPSIAAVKKFGLDAVMHATTFIKDGISLEVHWHIYHIDRSVNVLRFLFLIDGNRTHFNEYLWQHAVPLTIRGAPAAMLSFEDLFVHVIVHGAEGGSRRPLRWVADAVWILRRENLQWDRVLENIDQGGYVFEMQIALRYLSERFEIIFPESFLAALNARSASRRTIHRYYQIADNHYALLGNFPLLWYRYWRYESEGSLWRRVCAFPYYLRVAWHILERDTIFTFVCKKYIERLGRFGSKLKRVAVRAEAE